MHPNWFVIRLGDIYVQKDKHLPWLIAVAEGDQKAFEYLYKDTSGLLNTICRKMLGNGALADEALQEAYVRIWHNASDYQVDKGEVLSWMVSIARYRCLDMLRYQKVRQEQDLNEEHNAQEQIVVEENSQLSHCIEALAPEQRQAIHLAYFRGFSHSEVVSYLGDPMGTVKSWIRRGLSQLKRCLGI
nr:sigma-70 family RNA polymerase sigma factor [Catenovulum agarivorans]